MNSGADFLVTSSAGNAACRVVAAPLPQPLPTIDFFPLLCRSTFIGGIPASLSRFDLLSESVSKNFFFFFLADVLKCFSDAFLLWRPLAGPWLWLLKTGAKWPPSSHRGFRGQVPLEPPLEGCIRRLWSWAWGGNTDTQLITAAHSAPS